jgi:hypothetical protein
MKLSTWQCQNLKSGKKEGIIMHPGSSIFDIAMLT